MLLESNFQGSICEMYLLFDFKMYETEKSKISAVNNSVAKWGNILFLKEIHFDLTGKQVCTSLS